MSTPTPQATPHRLTDDAGAVVAFDGTLLARVSSESDAPGKRLNYSRLEAWRTSEGRFVIQRTKVSRGQPQVTLEAFASRQAAQAWLGFGALSLRLYAAAGWPL